MTSSNHSSTVDGNSSQELIHSVVPPQRVGGQSNVDIAVTCSSAAAADSVYDHLKILLVNVNQWHRHVKGVTAHFNVTDKKGSVIQEHANPGYHFKIRIPGPTLRVGGGYDWITVADSLEIRKGQAVMFYITAVPSRNPNTNQPETAHFLESEASTTFIALKQDRLVRMLIKSRNEVPNTGVGGWRDRMRNRMVGFFAAIYLSRFQWKKLAKSLLRDAVKEGDPKVIGTIITEK